MPAGAATGWRSVVTREAGPARYRRNDLWSKLKTALRVIEQGAWRVEKHRRCFFNILLG